MPERVACDSRQQKRNWATTARSHWSVRGSAEDRQRHRPITETRSPRQDKNFIPIHVGGVRNPHNILSFYLLTEYQIVVFLGTGTLSIACTQSLARNAAKRLVHSRFVALLRDVPCVNKNGRSVSDGQDQLQSHSHAISPLQYHPDNRENLSHPSHFGSHIKRPQDLGLLKTLSIACPSPSSNRDTPIPNTRKLKRIRYCRSARRYSL